jgi:hypothetical protein
LIGILLPFIVFLSLTLLFGLLAGLAAKPLVHEGRIFGFIFWLTLTHISGFYMTTGLGDLRQAYLLLTNKPWYSWTPFDFFFSPWVDWSEIRRTAKGEHDARLNLL